MTMKKIKSSDILGDNYYIYELTSSNYTPTLNSSITVTCILKNIYGDTIANKSLQLYQNDALVGSTTTNSNGVATWTVTCSSAGIQKFSVKDSIIEVFVDTTSKTGHTHTKSQITDFPNIPSKTSDLTNDSHFISTSSTTGLIKNDGSIDTNTYLTTHQDISGKANISDLGATAFSNDYTDLDNLPSIPSASSTVPSADTSSGSYGSGTTYARSNHTHPKSSLYAEASHTHTKSQITDFPSIPSKISDLTNDSNFIETSSTNGLMKNDGSIDTSSYITSSAITTHNSSSSAHSSLFSGKADSVHTHSTSDITDLPTIPTKTSDLVNDSNFLTSHQDISGKEDTSNKVTSWSNTTTDAHYPSEKLVKSSLDDKISKSNTSGLVKNDGTIDTTSYSTFSGSYNDLTNKPPIPDTLENLTLGTGAVQTYTGLDVMTYDDTIDVLYWGLGALSLDLGHDEVYYNSYEIATLNDIPVITGKENTSNKVKSTSGWSSTPTDDHYPSEKLVKSSLDNKVDKENGKGLFSGSYGDLSNKPSYTPTVTSSTTGAYKMGSINISGSSVDIYGKDTHQSLTDYIQKTSTDTGFVKSNGDITSFGTSLGTVAEGNHTHGNINNNGTVTTTKTTSVQNPADYGSDYFLIRDVDDNNSTKSANVIDVLNKIVEDLIDEGES